MGHSRNGLELLRNHEEVVDLYTLGFLSRDPDPSVRLAALERPEMNEEAFRIAFAAEEDEHTRVEMLALQNAPTDLLVSYSQSKDPLYRAAIARNPNLSDQLIADLSSDPDTRVRRALVSNTDITIDTFIIGRLARDTDSLVRVALLGRQSSPLGRNMISFEVSRTPTLA